MFSFLLSASAEQRSNSFLEAAVVIGPWGCVSGREAGSAVYEFITGRAEKGSSGLSLSYVLLKILSWKQIAVTTLRLFSLLVCRFVLT